MTFNLMIKMGGAAVAALLSGVALAAPGESDGNLYAQTAIVSGQFDQAERILQPVGLADANDPARLINIATVFSQTDRVADARAALNRVNQLPDEQLELSNGRSYSSHKLASALLARMPAGR